MKKCLKTLTGILLITLLSACSTVVADKSEDYSNQTLTGQISEINGTSVTITLGKLKEVKNEGNFEIPQGDFDPSQMGEGELPELPDGEMPQLPDGELPDFENGERPELPDGEKPDFQNGERPERPDGSGKQGGMKQRPEDDENFDPSEMGELPEGEMPDFENGERPQRPEGDGGKGGMISTYTFNAKDKTATIDLSGAEVSLADGSTGSLEDLKVDDVVEITVSENNKVTSVKVCQIAESEEIS